MLLIKNLLLPLSTKIIKWWVPEYLTTITFLLVSVKREQKNGSNIIIKTNTLSYFTFLHQIQPAKSLASNI